MTAAVPEGVCFFLAAYRGLRVVLSLERHSGVGCTHWWGPALSTKGGEPQNLESFCSV